MSLPVLLTIGHTVEALHVRKMYLIFCVTDSYSSSRAVFHAVSLSFSVPVASLFKRDALLSVYLLNIFCSLTALNPSQFGLVSQCFLCRCPDTARNKNAFACFLPARLLSCTVELLDYFSFRLTNIHASNFYIICHHVHDMNL